MRLPHAIRPNEQCRTPKRVIAIRCEPRIERVGGGGAPSSTQAAPPPTYQVATFGEATIIEAYRSEKTGRWSEPVKLVFDDPEALWREITGYTRVHGRTWLVGHTMGNELRIAQAFRWMPVLQWTFNPDPIVSDTTLSIGWHNGKRSLLAVDLFSYLPHSLEVLRARSLAFGECEAIFTAFMDLVSLQHDHDLGNFSRTGASNASNHWRHRHMTSKVSIHDDQSALDAERDSIFTGRTEAWRIGIFRDLEEWDLPLAYPRVGLDTYMPVRLVGLQQRGPSPLEGRLGLVHAHVDLPVPVLPRRDTGGRITWPVGRVEGWYWQPELDLAVEYGAEVTALEQYVYETAPVLKTWAEWIIDVVEKGGGHSSAGEIHTPVSVTPPAFTAIQQMAVKHWGRALIGKFGAQVPDWKPYAWFDDCDLELCRSVVDGRVGEMLTVGGRALRSEEKCYADNAFPALMSRVISECRMRLWHLMCAAGLDNVYYVDTDSLFVNMDGSRRLHNLVDKGGGWGVRVKTRHREVTILGPRQLITAREGLRISGLPKAASATPAEPGNQAGYEADVTESFRGGASSGRGGEVVTRSRPFRLKGTDERRVHLAGGFTEARTA
jgi:hypothetical protein